MTDTYKHCVGFICPTCGQPRCECTEEAICSLAEENGRLQQHINDLQSGMYVNCVYCGHRYGPNESTPVSMAEVLKQHVEQCPKHPMSALRNQLTRIRDNYVLNPEDAEAIEKLIEEQQS